MIRTVRLEKEGDGVRYSKEVAGRHQRSRIIAAEREVLSTGIKKPGLLTRCRPQFLAVHICHA